MQQLVIETPKYHTKYTLNYKKTEQREYKNKVLMCFEKKYNKTRNTKMRKIIRTVILVLSCKYYF